jgi:glycosyltransferase involved in cell wall biosynthesis
MEHRKGTVELLQAIQIVLRQVPEACFILIGADRPHAPGGRTHREYLAQDFPVNVQRQITLTGPLPQIDVDRYLQAADVFVAPSRYESFGLIYLEAMRWGTPVIGTWAGGIPEIVEHERSGLLVTTQDPSELAAAIVRLITTPSLRERLGRAGRKRVEQEFSVQRMSERMAALYQELCTHLGNGDSVLVKHFEE